MAARESTHFLGMVQAATYLGGSAYSPFKLISEPPPKLTIGHTSLLKEMPSPQHDALKARPYPSGGASTQTRQLDSVRTQITIRELLLIHGAPQNRWP
jgi:hypothetical protein